MSNGFTPHQMLLTVIYEMNNGDTIIRECDITNEMRHFNEDINPFYLDCSALNAPQEIQITPVVNDWN